jgi:hypothetical protein
VNQPASSTSVTDPVMKIIGVLPSMSFIKYVIQSHVFQTGIMTYGRPEFYLVMAPVLYFVSIVYGCVMKFTTICTLLCHIEQRAKCGLLWSFGLVISLYNIKFYIFSLFPFLRGKKYDYEIKILSVLHVLETVDLFHKM